MARERVAVALEKARKVFDAIIESSDERLTRKDLLRMLGDEDLLDPVRNALVATGKIEKLRGRGGGLAILSARGNKREWGDTAESRARDYLDELFSGDAESTVRAADRDRDAAWYLERVTDQWSQKQIADALSVSQATVSNWSRGAPINGRYTEALQRLWQATAKESPEESTTEVERVDEPAYGDWLRGELENKKLDATQLAEKSGVNINTLLALLEGRTERPQQRTRKRIESALGGTNRVEVAEVGAEVDWYYMGLSWTKDEIDQVPEEPGVYIIHDRLGRPAYVGVAHAGRGIRGRLLQHDEKKWTSDRRVASRFSYALTKRMPREDPAALAKAIEKLLIKFMGNSILINEKDLEDLRD